MGRAGVTQVSLAQNLESVCEDSSRLHFELSPTPGRERPKNTDLETVGRSCQE